MTGPRFRFVVNETWGEPADIATLPADGADIVGAAYARGGAPASRMYRACAVENSSR